jgi:signal transduction histidine kinase
MGVERYNFSWDSGFKDRDGKIFFGNDQGYYVIDAGFLNRETKAPEIKLTGFRLTDEYVTPNEKGPLKEVLSEAEKIVLDYDQNIFSFDFATIDYTNPDRNRMIYYLENFDRNWSLANSENRAYYFNVPPGEYTFHVKSSKGAGPWASRKIDLIISPPWWRTWWAYSAYAIILGLCIFGFDRFMRHRLIRIERERSREKELKQAKEIEKAYTELKNTQAQLIQSEKMASLGELTAGIAHEIQNPLNFVNNFSEVSQELVSEMREELENGQMKEVLELSEHIENNLEKISHHGKRASDIVKGMLQHSRATGSTKEKTDLNKLADEYFRLAYHGLRAKDKSFTSKMETSFDEKLEKIKVIPQDIGRVLLNIITNAFHVVSEKKKDAPDSYEPSVMLSTKNLKDSIEIRISDNGNGIPKEILEKIFQPFFTTKPSGKGTGLGLSLSYDIVKAHGGQLQVDTQEGAGTTFIIKLPKT